MGPSKDLVERVRAWVADGTPLRPGNPQQAKDFEDAAAAQGLLAWLDDALAARTLSDWPERVAADIRARHRRALFEAVQRQALALRTQRLLSTHGIRAVPMKGAALADTYYPSPAHRPMSDVDLLALERADGARAALH